jgi:hypothetical protein
MELSKNFTLEEFTYSETAKKNNIDNSTDKAFIINNLKELCSQVLQPLRDKIEKPINITSGYRCLKLNEKVGGVPTSQHVLGQACDLKVDDMTPFEIAQVVLELYLPFDQMVLYNDFLHISISTRDRRQLCYNKSYNGEQFD